MGLMFENETELMAEREAERKADAAWLEMFKEAESDNWQFDRAKDEAKAFAARIKREGPVLAAIAAAVTDGTVLDGKLFIKGVDVSFHLDFKKEWTIGIGRSGLGSKPTGKVSLVVGKYGSRTRYPMRKDGTYNYADIARTLEGIAVASLLEAERKRAVAANNNKVEALRTELGLADYYGPMKLGTSASKKEPFEVAITFKSAMTEAKVREVYAALVALGMVKSKE